MIETRTAAPLVYPDTESMPVEVRPKTPREVGEHAARYIEEHGWLQGDYWNGDGAVCLVGGMVKVADEDSPQFNLAWNALTAAVNHPSLFAWNDAPERTEAEVLAALRAIR